MPKRPAPTSSAEGSTVSSGYRFSLQPLLNLVFLFGLAFPFFWGIDGQPGAQERVCSPEDSSSVGTDSLPFEQEDTSLVPAIPDTVDFMVDTLPRIEAEDSAAFPVVPTPAKFTPEKGQYSLVERMWGEDLEDAKARDLSGLLEQSSNVDVFTYGPYGSPTSFAILSIPPLGTEIVVDGIPFRSPGVFLPFYDGVDLHTIPIENLDSLRVFYGGMASNSPWGNPVVLVELDSKNRRSLGGDPEEVDKDSFVPRSRVRVERGPYQYHRSQIEFGSRLFHKLDYFLSIGVRKTTGYLLSNQMDGLYLSGRFSYPLRRNLVLKMNLLRQRLKRGFPLFDYSVSQNPRKTQEVSALGFSCKYKWRPRSHLFLRGFYLYQPQTLKDFTLGIHDKYEDRSWGGRAGTEFLWEGHRFLIEVGSITGGLKINQRSEESSLESWLGFSNEISFSDKLKLLGSARVLNHDEYDDFLLPTLGLCFAPGHGSEFYSSVFRRVNTPTLYQICWPPESYHGGFQLLGAYDYREQGNPDLKPQVWWGADLGFQFKRHTIDLFWYLLYANIDDLVLWSNQGSSFNVIHRPVNTFAGIWGSSLGGNLKPRDDISLHLSYTYKHLDTDEIPSPDITPLHTIFGWGEAERSFLKGKLKLKGRIEGRYTSDRYLLGFREIYQPSVLVVGYSLQFQYLDFCFYYQGENLTNQEYLTWGYNPMPRRYYWWGIRWDFTD